MRYYVLTDGKDVSANHRKMYKNLEKGCTKTGKAIMGYQGGHDPVKVWYDAKADIWWHKDNLSSEHLREYPDTKYWNPFGLGEPKWEQDNHMLVQFNYRAKNYRRLNGALVQDDNGRVYIAHSGALGGRYLGQKIPIPKNHRIKRIKADDGRKDLLELFLISDIKSHRLAQNIREYLEFVRNVKEPEPSIEEESKFVIANITWNDSNWRDIYINPQAGHKYARENPGNESLNFDFNKEGLDDETHVFGHVQWRGQPRRFQEPGVIFFFTKNLETRQNEIVGVYGNAEILNPARKTEWRGFENNKLVSNVKAEKDKSILFPIPLYADQYSKWKPEWKRLVPQSGLRYISQDLASAMITNEIHLILNSGIWKNELFALFSIFELITGKTYIHIVMADERQQLQLEKIANAEPRAEIIKRLKNVEQQFSKLVTVQGQAYKRDNQTIADLKIYHYYKCQICKTRIKKEDGSYYIEAAHIKPKSKKGPETPDNILILCPNHHKEFDYGNTQIIKHSKKKIVFKMNGKRHEIDLAI